MAFKLHDWIMDTSNTTGTDDFLLAGPVLTWRGFGNMLADGDTTYYSASFEGHRETGLGTYVAGSGTLQRTTIYESTNGGAKVSFAAGTKVITCAPPASRMLTRTKDEFEVHKSGNQTSSALAKVTFETVIKNVGGMFHTGSGRAIPGPGKSVILKGSIQVGSAAGTYVTLHLYKNGAEFRRQKSPDASSIVTDLTVSLIEPVLGNGTDYYEWFYSFTGGGGITITATPLATYFSGVEF